MSQSFLNHSQFHLLYDLADDYVFFMRKVDSTYVYEFINKKAEELFSESPIGKSLDECFDEFHNKTIVQHYDRAWMQKKSVCYQDHYCVTTESYINETTAVPIFENGFTYILATTKEVSRTAHLQESTYVLETFRKAINEVALVAMTNEDGVIEVVNELFETTSKFSKEELVGNTFHMINSNYHDESFFDNMWKVVKNGDIWHGQIRNRTKFGSFYWVNAIVVPIKNDLGQIEKFLTIQFDNTEKKRMMSELRNIERSFKLITEHSNDLIAITDAEGYLLYSSPSHETILKYDKEELLGSYYFNLITDQSELINYSKLELVEKYRVELLLQTKDGNSIWTDTSITTVESTVDDEEEKWFVIVSREITEKRALEDQLMFMAFHDSLTSLPNRRSFYEDFPVSISSASVEFPNVALLYIDGDNFKGINDMYGHDVGDQFLTHFAENLQISLNNKYNVYRIGGDEFVVIIDRIADYVNGRSQTVDEIVQVIQQNLRRGWIIEDINFSPTSSIGIAIFPNDGSSTDELLDNADQALYTAKKNGKNNYIYTNAVHS
ncbi:PAS domain S-box-containing protein/diguanylate cyclase (GGDEF) domain-containing protein [Psychrobacillus sp. OK028]|uniref:sensor domain-containing protein n=1 Tax=Psychrobacillus sp. OK028 TaxID=1884359 RepID=UPI0008812691|nr:diguanylate cyclase [Psychrobacillus sp. OK028]SDN07401.1 PAS domain S-box-containing protein/diguanylate cyclase (GGDEF) domain-containing protein [Psychrobacillus sp. OK028]